MATENRVVIISNVLTIFLLALQTCILYKQTKILDNQTEIQKTSAKETLQVVPEMEKNGVFHIKEKYGFGVVNFVDAEAFVLYYISSGYCNAAPLEKKRYRAIEVKSKLKYENENLNHGMYIDISDINKEAKKLEDYYNNNHNTNKHEAEKKCINITVKTYVAARYTQADNLPKVYYANLLKLEESSSEIPQELNDKAIPSDCFISAEYVNEIPKIDKKSSNEDPDNCIIK